MKGIHQPDGPIQLGTKITEMRKFMGRISETSGEIIDFEFKKNGEKILMNFKQLLESGKFEPR